MKRIIFLILFTVFVLYLSPLFAMRCGNDLVQPGDATYTVLKRCGKPTYEEHFDRVVIHRGIRNIENLDVWTYDFGPQDFVYTLRFEEGTLINIEAHLSR